MSAIGVILQSGLSFTSKITSGKRNHVKGQTRTLARILRKAETTIFGQEYKFGELVYGPNLEKEFAQAVPIHTYEEMERWWKMSMEGEPNVCWPGSVDTFALSSGTSSGASKYIPVTRTMLKAMQRGSVRQIASLGNFDLTPGFFDHKIMMLGGSTSLQFNGMYFAGDLSGITTRRLPIWFQPYYKPGKMISQTKDWQTKLDLIVEQAHLWDIGAIVGVPSWYQLLLERIIAHNKVDHIHDIWPNLDVYVHGGVAFDPYRPSFERLLGRPIIYMETYLASEGFIAYQASPQAQGMRLLLRNGIYYEFIPFNEKNFDEEGVPLPSAKAVTLAQVVKGEEYALLLSSCAGAWRYMIGDVITFTDIAQAEIRITGRTKHFLSLCGEHLSVDNMNKAVELTAKELSVAIREFAVAGKAYQSGFGHEWYLGTEKHVDREVLTQTLDKNLRILNDDYDVERQHALHTIRVHQVPHQSFLAWLKSEGREGAQIKFPRVLNKKQLPSWNAYLEQNYQSDLS